jgi:hypothetical protein
MLDLPPRIGRRMKTWEKIGWFLWMVGCGFVFSWGIYVFTH